MYLLPDLLPISSERRGAQALEDWTWQKQLRYYMKGGSAAICMSSARFGYSYEYQGNAPKLVHTPLTDKCYLTLTQVCERSRPRVRYDYMNLHAPPKMRLSGRVCSLPGFMYSTAPSERGNMFCALSEE